MDTIKSVAMSADIQQFDELKVETETFLHNFDDNNDIVPHLTAYFKSFQQALKTRRPLSVNAVLSFRKSNDFTDLIGALIKISRTDLRNSLSTEQHADRQKLVKAILKRMKSLQSSSLNVIEMGFSALLSQTSVGKFYSFGRVRMTFNLPVEDREGLSMNHETERENFCKSCEIFLVTSRYYSENLQLLSDEQYNSFLSNETEVLKLEPTKLKPTKKAKVSDSAEALPRSSICPRFCRQPDDNQTIDWLEWTDLQVQCNSKFESFKQDGRRNTNELVAKSYYNLVFKFVLPDIEVIYTNPSGPNPETASFQKLPVFVVSPDFVLETHTKQDIDPDGYYLWKLAFGSFDEDQTIENIVDKMLMPRFKGVLANALEAIERSEISKIGNTSSEIPKIEIENEGSHDMITSFTRDAIYHAICSLLQDLRKKRPRDDDRRRRNANIRTSSVSNEMTADELVGEPLERSKKRIWSWFQEICDSIDLQRSGRESTKDTVVKRENFGRMIKDGVHMGIMTKEQAEKILSKQPIGTFLLRFSTSQPECKIAVSIIRMDATQMIKIDHFSYPVSQAQTLESAAFRIHKELKKTDDSRCKLLLRNETRQPISVLANYYSETASVVSSPNQEIYRDGNQLSEAIREMSLSGLSTPASSSFFQNEFSPVLSDVLMPSPMDQQQMNMNINPMGDRGSGYTDLHAMSDSISFSPQITQVMVAGLNQGEPQENNIEPGSVRSFASDNVLPPVEFILTPPESNIQSATLQQPNEDDDSPENVYQSAEL
ncbi:uncharacterized protein LOC134852840 isoform X2 [Symsagittifera roscoffensis]|uniref:uncharacterized protein LOC134852840 isoform X2 n=1 Tax=Symsagittifera roscoffensis TaxID=84072 RepID=UPI00307C84E1